MRSLTFLGAARTVTGSKYLLETDGTRILVDCGLFQGFKELRERNWQPLPVEASSIDAVILTHAHLDHITGVARAREAFGAPVGLHRDDLFLYEAVVQHGLAFGLRVDPQPPPDFFYTPGESIGFGTYEARVHHTPGHCPGGVCLQVGKAGEAGCRLFVGDTLFAGSIGRTDLPGGDYETLMRSIRDVLMVFPDDFEVYPGHGPVTTIGEERTTNPFLTGGM